MLCSLLLILEKIKYNVTFSSNSRTKHSCTNSWPVFHEYMLQSWVLKTKKPIDHPTGTLRRFGSKLGTWFGKLWRRLGQCLLSKCLNSLLYWFIGESCATFLFGICQSCFMMRTFTNLDQFVSCLSSLVLFQPLRFVLEVRITSFSRDLHVRYENSQIIFWPSLMVIELLCYKKKEDCLSFFP